MRQHATPREATPSSPLAAAALAALFVLAGWLGVVGTGAPPSAGHDAPATAFSAARAMDTLSRILGDEAPHPTGSAANAAVRDRIVADLQALGLDPEGSSRLSCSASDTAPVAPVPAGTPR